MTHKYIRIADKTFSWTLYAITTGIILTCLYWIFYPYQTTTYADEPFKMNKTTYQQGEDAHYQVSYCKFTDQKPTIHRYFVDGLKIEAAENKSAFSMGCHTDQEVHFMIPKSLPPGHWRMTAVATYKFNPLREEVTNTHSTEWFTVTRAAGGAYGDIK